MASSSLLMESCCSELSEIVGRHKIIGIFIALMVAHCSITPRWSLTQAVGMEIRRQTYLATLTPFYICFQKP